MNNENSNIDPIALFPKILSGEASPAERKIILEWLSESKENSGTFESFRRLWNLTAPVHTGEIDIDVEWQRMEKNISPVFKPVFFSSVFIKIAAAIILVSALAFVGLRSLNVKTIRSSSAQTAGYDLPDGTEVSLNAESRITYRRGFGSTHRNVELKGEAFFEVEKSAVPFIVTAGNAEIRVTGTRFNVSSYPDKKDLRVTVTEGSVHLAVSGQPEKQIMLKAGESGMYVNGSVSKDTTFDLNAIAWKTGIMEFNNTPLSKVTEVLQNTYHIPFSVDSAVMKCAITVRFENQEADSVLQVLRSTLDVNITRKGKRVLITGSGC